MNKNLPDLYIRVKTYLQKVGGWVREWDIKNLARSMGYRPKEIDSVLDKLSNDVEIGISKYRYRHYEIPEDLKILLKKDLENY